MEGYSHNAQFIASVKQIYALKIGKSEMGSQKNASLKKNGHLMGNRKLTEIIL